MTVITEPLSHPFKVGDKCRTTDKGDRVVIVEEKNEPGNECVKGDDGLWRYNHEPERGRVCGTLHGHPRDLMLKYTEAGAAKVSAEFDRKDKIARLRKGIAQLEGCESPDRRIDDRLRELRAELRRIENGR